MGLRGLAILLLPLLLLASTLHAQFQPPSEQLTIAGKLAATWKEGESSVIQIEGNATIELDRVKMSADRAVIWLTPVSQQNLDLQNVQVALLGNVNVEQSIATRSGDRLIVNGQLRGSKMSITAEQRQPQDLSRSETYAQALSLRGLQIDMPELPVESPATAPAAPGRPSVPNGRRPRAATRPAGSGAPVYFQSTNLQTTNSGDGHVAAVLTGGVSLIQRRETGDLIELRADRAVLFTSLNSLKDLTEPGQRNRRMSETILGAYLEGDVRINYSPNRKGMGEQRLTSDRAYYDFGTDRAVLTNAILHTAEPSHQTPMVARARILRQLSVGEYRATNMQLTTSKFALPSYSIAADRMYVREDPATDPEIGPTVMYEGQGVTFQVFNVPFFWTPFASGTLEKGEPLREFGFGNSTPFGFEARSEWGLFETLGTLPPQDLDVNYRLDYFSERGPGFGLNGAYRGGFLTDTTKDPWDFHGMFHSYFVYDHGIDAFGRLPLRENVPAELRGEALWEHQHFFPDNWLAQVRAGWVSDATFMEQWFRRDFETDQPHNIMVYLKHQDQTETFSLDLEYQPLKLVTTSNEQQEQFEVERLPELRYERLGDGLLNDNLTLFSDNRAAGMRFEPSRTSLLDQGFVPPFISPGIPALGTTGVARDVTWRGDFRQEVDWPLTAGPLRIVPYVFGRYTQYSNSPTGSEVARFFAGAGTRITTQIWKTDPSVKSDLFDIHQIRHVIEPEVNLFTSATNVDNTKVFIYDEDVDKINDISAAQLALHQRWQTKRGGAGEWRSVDVFALNVDVDWFANKPTKANLNPYNFRGVYFSSLPEASIPRDAINADASWRISDNTVVLADTSFNLDKDEVQTIGLGVLLQRSDRLSMFIGNRYISDLHSNIISVAANYQLTTKYTISVDQEFDFSQSHNVFSNVSLIRRFDTFLLAGRYYVDEITGETGFNISFYPIGLGTALDSGSLQTFRR